MQQGQRDAPSSVLSEILPLRLLTKVGCPAGQITLPTCCSFCLLAHIASNVHVCSLSTKGFG